MLLVLGPWAELFSFGMAAGIRVGWILAGGMWLFAGLFQGSLEADG